MTQTMRALVLTSYEDGILHERQIAKPVPGPGGVLVRIAVSGLNPIDTKIREGVAPYAMPELPAVLGTDMAGVVTAVGPGVTAFREGDEVYGLTGGVRGLQGSLAEYAAVDADLLALKPKTLSFREAAALPLVSLTAWEGLVDRMGVRKGQTVLVQGGAGGVGHAAIQIAKIFGADIHATGSAGKQNIIRDLGAEPIDYNTLSVEDYVRDRTGGEGFDLSYDTVGGTSLDASLAAVRAYGHVSSCAAFGTHDFVGAALNCVTLSGIFVLMPMLSGKSRAHHGEILREIARYADEGLIKPMMDPKRYGFADATAAYDAQAAGQIVGKAVIEI